MNTFKTSKIITRTIGTSAIAAALALSASVFADPTQRVGNPYTPTGSDFSIFALQGIDSSNPTGQSGFATQVNLNFEMTPSIGVSYDQGNGQLKDFGIGLYQAGGPGHGNTNPVESTGLLVQYDSLVNASSANLTLEDFDLDKNATGFKPDKVTPSMLIYGANNTLLGTATSSEIFSAMVAQPKMDDVWNLNLGTLLTDMHSTSTAVSKVQLYADATMGEKTNSDPYLLRSVGKAQPVPEPGTLCALASGVLLLRRRRAKANA